MASIAELGEAMRNWVHENILGSPNGAFFQTRTTHTPGMVGNVKDAGAEYNPSLSPADVAKNSTWDAQVRNQLAQQWAGQPNGMIRVNPGRVTNLDLPLDDQLANRTLRHEQVHAIYDHGNLSGSAPQIDPLLNIGFKNYVDTSPVYSMQDYPARINEALAYQIAATHENKEDLYLPPEEKLSGKIAKILSSKGQDTLARQIKELAK